VESYWGNVNPVGERSCYDEGKRAAETLCFDYRRTHNLDVRVGRIFNTYGPRMDPNDGRVVSNFITQALRGREITVYGDGKQTRSFCYVDDLLSGITMLMSANQNENNERFFSAPFNIGNPSEFTILELAQLILDKLGVNSKLAFEPLPSDDPKQRKPDISKIQNVTQCWMPKIKLDAGLSKTIEHFKDSEG
jgi:UDP-glucuronate decarboxylase